MKNETVKQTEEGNKTIQDEENENVEQAEESNKAVQAEENESIEQIDSETQEGTKLAPFVDEVCMTENGIRYQVSRYSKDLKSGQTRLIPVESYLNSESAKERRHELNKQVLHDDMPQ